MVEPLLAGTPVVIAGYNSPQQTVVSGPVAACEEVGARAGAQGLFWTRIAVSHAFHSEAVAPAAVAFGEHLSGVSFAPLARTMVSTVTGDVLPADADVADLLRRQVLDPVRFTQAVSRLAENCDLLLEVGPGKVLRGLASEIAPQVPTISLETDSLSLSGLLNAVGAGYALGAPVNHEALFQDRFTRPLEPGRPLKFLASPAESAPAGDFAVARTVDAPAGATSAPSLTASGTDGTGGVDTLELLRRLAAERAELPLEAVRPDSRPLDELHLSSITVGQIVNQAARELNVAAPTLTSSYATATVAEIAQILDEAGGAGRTGDADERESVAGVAPWVRAFAVDLVPTEVGPRAGACPPGTPASASVRFLK